MRIFLKTLIPAVMITVFGIEAAPACTTFFIHHKGQSVFGKNYDWMLGRGMIVINKKGVLKKAMAVPEMDKGPYAEWVSKYGSLTFNQYGREFPTGGMNEAGLVIHLMILMETAFPAPDKRPVIKELQWIQYHLDNFKTVDEVVNSQSSIRILTMEKPGLHYLVADQKGDCATIEFLHGKLVVHRKDRLPVTALANSKYSDSLAYLKSHEGFGGQAPITRGESSLKRFVFASKMLRDFRQKPQKSMVDYAFKTLDSVKQAASTQWSIVYDLNALRVYYHTRQSPGMKVVDLSTFDLKCPAPVETVNMDIGSKGNISHLFQDYSKAANYNLLRDAFKGTPFLKDIPDSVIKNRAMHPEGYICGEKH